MKKKETVYKILRRMFLREDAPQDKPTNMTTKDSKENSKKKIIRSVKREGIYTYSENEKENCIFYNSFEITSDYINDLNDLNHFLFYSKNNEIANEEQQQFCSNVHCEGQKDRRYHT